MSISNEDAKAKEFSEFLSTHKSIERTDFYLNRFLKLLFKFGNQEAPGSVSRIPINNDVRALLTCIVSKEDSKEINFERPVNFWNDQLSDELGFKSPKGLNNARTLAVSSGWLRYFRESNRAIGYYFVTIPDWVKEELKGDSNHSKYGMNEDENTEGNHSKYGTNNCGNHSKYGKNEADFDLNHSRNRSQNDSSPTTCSSNHKEDNTYKSASDSESQTDEALSQELPPSEEANNATEAHGFDQPSSPTKATRRPTPNSAHPLPGFDGEPPRADDGRFDDFRLDGGVQGTPAAPRKKVKAKSVRTTSFGRPVESRKRNGTLTLMAVLSDEEQAWIQSVAFPKFYAIYPRKEARADAQQAMVNAVSRILAEDHRELPTVESAAQCIIDGIKRNAPAIAASEFQKYPATWLNKGCYDDQPGSPEVAAKQAMSQSDALEMQTRERIRAIRKLREEQQNAKSHG